VTVLSALPFSRGDIVALVGAGGKTSLAYRLAGEAEEAGLKVLVTATTHMGTMAESTMGRLFLDGEGPLEGFAEALAQGRVTLLSRRIRHDKIEGLSPGRVEALARHADLVIVEADGARGRSLKVPASHEPVVPAAPRLVVVLGALDVLGRPMSEEGIHRLALVEEATGRAAGQVLDEAAFAAALLHGGGYPARIPPGARSAVFLNKAEDEGRWACADRIASALLARYDLVLAGSARGGPVRVYE